MNATTPGSDSRPDGVGFARKLPFGAPAAAVVAYVFLSLVGKLIGGSGHPAGVTVGAMIAVFILAPLLGGLGLVAAVRGVLANRRRKLMLFAALLNLALIVGPYALFVSH